MLDLEGLGDVVVEGQYCLMVGSLISNPLCVFRMKSHASHVVDKYHDRNIGKGSFDVEKRTITSCFLLHALFVNSTNQRMASVAVRPLRPPYWLVGNRFSHSTSCSQ